MPYEVLDLGDDYAEVKITGEMQVRDQEALQEMAEPWLAAGKRMSLLVLLEDFSGWEHSKGWEDVSLVADHGNDFTKIAVVGDDRWRDEVYIFLGKGLRETEIEFFTTGSFNKARAWLNAP